MHVVYVSMLEMVEYTVAAIVVLTLIIALLDQRASGVFAIAGLWVAIFALGTETLFSFFPSLGDWNWLGMSLASVAVIIFATCGTWALNETAEEIAPWLNRND